MLICPRTKQVVPYDEQMKEKLKAYARMPIEYKRTQLTKTLNLAPIPEGTILEDEMLAEMLKEDIVQLPFLYENTRMLPIDNLQEAGKKHVVPLVLQIL